MASDVTVLSPLGSLVIHIIALVLLLKDLMKDSHMLQVMHASLSLRYLLYKTIV